MARLLRPSACYAATPAYQVDGTPSYSAFRARLRGRDEAATAATLLATASLQPILDPQRENLYQQFCFGLGPEVVPRPVPSTPAELRANNSEAAAQLRESLAEVGSDLHAAAIEQLVESHRDIETKITDLANSSGPVLSRVDSVYSNIEYPLGATICHSDALRRETITTHLSNLQAKFDDADKELRKLAAEYDSCVRFEEAALSKLRGHRGDTEGGSAEMIRAEQRKAHDFKKEAEDISRRTGRLLEEAEADFRESAQAETMKIMQTMMAD